MAISSDDMLKLAQNVSCQKMLSKMGDNHPEKERVVLSVKLGKINKRGKEQNRILLLTDKALYNLKPKEIGKCQRRIYLEKIVSITISTTSQEFAIHIPEEYDYRYKSCYKDRIASVLAELYKKKKVIKKLVINKIQQDSMLEVTVTKDVARLQSREQRLRRYQELIDKDNYDDKIIDTQQAKVTGQLIESKEKVKPYNDTSSIGNLVYAIGRNYASQSLLKVDFNKDTNITTIHSADGITIYSNINSKNHYIYPFREWLNIHNITISKICTSLNSADIYYISNDHCLYHYNDYNKYSYFDKNPRFINNTVAPQYLCQITNTLNGNTFSISYALNVEMIINIWCHHIPTDIVILIETYHEMQPNVYRSNNFTESISDIKFEKIKCFRNKFITKIAAGSQHVLFLERNGILWSFGNNKYGQRGTAFFGEQYKEYTMIGYFIENNIQIIDIKCGKYHSLAIDDRYNVYSWGMNEYGQCHSNINVNVSTPNLIESLQKYEIVSIECGAYHCYAKSKNNKHFLWGNNMNKECIVMNTGKVLEPFCINDIVTKQTNGRIIKAVSLGNGNTKIIVS